MVELLLVLPGDTLMARQHTLISVAVGVGVWGAQRRSPLTQIEGCNHGSFLGVGCLHSVLEMRCSQADTKQGGQDASGKGVRNFQAGRWRYIGKSCALGNPVHLHLRPETVEFGEVSLRDQGTHLGRRGYECGIFQTKPSGLSLF